MIPSGSRACHRCFTDKILIDLIREEERRGWCDWCGGRNVYVIPLYKLGDIFRDVLSIYAQGDANGDPISYLLQEDWNIFSNRIEQAPDDLMQQLAVAILKSSIEPKDYYSGDYPDYEDFFRRKDAWLAEHWHEKAEAFFLGGQRNLQEILPSIPNHITTNDDFARPIGNSF